MYPVDIKKNEIIDSKCVCNQFLVAFVSRKTIPWLYVLERSTSNDPSKCSAFTKAITCSYKWHTEFKSRHSEFAAGPVHLMSIVSCSFLATSLQHQHKQVQYTNVIIAAQADLQKTILKQKFELFLQSLASNLKYCIPRIKHRAEEENGLCCPDFKIMNELAQERNFYAFCALLVELAQQRSSPARCLSGVYFSGGSILIVQI